ncbi:hypothetical protein GCM10009576_042830 [Streptomyces rhizosphaericus]|uniref:Uncharacterized protein n=1 Tax=Streptomyces rhizosphaericus TaxID=114699 RepID=A0ABP4CTY0_9ACTN
MRDHSASKDGPGKESFGHTPIPGVLMRENKTLVTSARGSVDLPYAALALEAAEEGAKAH